MLHLHMPLLHKDYFELKALSKMFLLKNTQQIQEGYSDSPLFLPENRRQNSHKEDDPFPVQKERNIFIIKEWDIETRKCCIDRPR